MPVSYITSVSKTNHFFDYWRIIYKRRWAIFACVFISVVTVIIANSLEVPVYTSSASILIDESLNSVRLPNQPYSYEDYYQKQRAFETHFKVIKSYPIIQMVVEELHLKDYLEKKLQPKPTTLQVIAEKVSRTINAGLGLAKRVVLNDQSLKTPKVVIEDVPKTDSMVLSLQSAIEVIPVSDTNLVEIKVTHSDPWITVNVANTLAKVYQEYISSRQRESLEENLNWMTQEVYKLKANTEEAEQALHNYREEESLLENEQENTLQAGEMAQLREDYNRTKTQRIELEARVEELKKVINKGSAYIPGFIKNDLLEKVTSQRVTTKLELEKLQKRYRDKHPKIIDVRTKLSLLEQQIMKEIKKSLAGIQSEYVVLLRKEKELEKSVKNYTSKVIKSDRGKIKYDLLEREVDNSRELYNLLMMQLKSLDISEGIKNRTIRLVEMAKFPEFPISRNKMLNLLVSLTMGLALGICLAFFLEYLDCTLKGVDDVKDTLNLPVLGVIPHFDKG